MKLNKYFLIAAMGLGLFACSDDGLDGNGQNGQDENKAPEVTTYAAIKLNFGNVKTRAVGDLPETGEENVGDGNEAAIKTVRLIITDAATDTIEHNMDNSVLTEYRIEASDQYVFPIKPGDKKVYAFVNEETGNDLASYITGKGKTFTGTQVLLNVPKKASELGVYNANSAVVTTPFVMSSVNEVKTWKILPGVDREAATNGPQNQVTLDVERMVAKVTVQLSNGLVAENGFENQSVTLTELTARIGNADNMRFIPAGNGNAAKFEVSNSYRMAYDDANVRKTPYYAYNYAKVENDNFTTESLFQDGVTPTSIYAPKAAGTDPKNPQARFYCLENTHAAGNYKEENTTFVRVTATMIPNEHITFVYESAVETTGVPTITPTVEETADFSTAATFYLVTGAPNADLSGGYVLQTTLANLYEKVMPTGTENGDAEKAAAVIGEFENNGYTFSAAYEEGVGHFNVWVNNRDENGNLRGISPVFRNDWYDLTINSIKLPGNPTGEVSPGTDIQPDTYIGVTLKVKAWNKINHDVDLQ